MKNRMNFVDNSVSTSFVLGKAYLTQNQIADFTIFLKEKQDSEYEWFDDEETLSDETYIIYDNPYYFYGNVGHRDIDLITKKLDEWGVDEKYIIFDE